LQFEASKGYSAKSDVAIDDISLSPECFAIGTFNIILNVSLLRSWPFLAIHLFANEYFFSAGVPRDVVGDFNYYNPVIEKEPSKHPDFVNETGT